MYLEGVIHQLDIFAMAAGVSRDEVRVRLTFSDGDSITVRGLHVTTPSGDTEWGMIRGAGTMTGAIVIREDDVRKVELQLTPQALPPIGFTAEGR